MWGNRPAVRHALLYSVALAFSCIGLMEGSVAQIATPSMLPPLPPTLPTTDRLGIDRVSGTIANLPLQSLTLGNDRSGLSANHAGGGSFNHISYLTVERVAIYNGGFMVIRVAARGSVHIFPIGTITQTTAPYGGSFQWDYLPFGRAVDPPHTDTFNDFNNSGATLVCSGNKYAMYGPGTCSIYLGSEGSRTDFKMPNVDYRSVILNQGYYAPDHVAHAWPTRTVLADGEAITYHYANYAERCGACGQYPPATAWNAVESSLGFRVYLSRGTPTGHPNPGVMSAAGELGGRVGNLFGINLAVEYADPLTLNRAFGPHVRVSATNPTSTGFTLVNQGTAIATVDQVTPFQLVIRRPSGARMTYSNMSGIGPYNTNNGQNGHPSDPRDAFPFLNFSVITRATTSYATSVNDSVVPERYTSTITNPDGSTEGAVVQHGLLKSATDALGRTTTFEYLDPIGVFYGIGGYTRQGRVTRITEPGGGSRAFTYAHGALSRVTVTPTDGSSPLVTEVGLAASCTVENYRVCNKPLYVRDPRGNQTDFTYDQAHGGVLTETGPPDQNAVRAQRRYTYALLYPQVLNASGQLVNSTPVWRVSRISECASSAPGNPASCVGTIAEQITTYAYNHSNLFLTQETVSSGDGSLTATTTYTYDHNGDVTVVDGPRTDVDDRTYATYDNLRRKVFEIGPDPDGPGPLRRPITRHVYDIDGRELRTEFGSGAATDGSDFAVQRFERSSFDPVTGDVLTREVVYP